MSRKALITGMSGQDAAYLARLLLNKGYSVTGSSRDAEKKDFKNLSALSITKDVEVISLNPRDYPAVSSLLRARDFDEIYHLGSQSSVSRSFEQPYSTIESSAFCTLNFLEAIRASRTASKLYHASSSECFGNNKSKITEKSKLSPVSPYGVAKTTASQLVRTYRECYSVFAVNGFLFNHESPLRGNRFVTSKIINSAFNIRKGTEKKLALGNVGIKRDWGWAPEFVDAMHIMLQQKVPSDYVIGTGKSYSLIDFIRLAFEFFDLEYKDFLTTEPTYFRPNEITENHCDPSKAQRELGWTARYKTPEVVKFLCQAKVEHLLQR